MEYVPYFLFENETLLHETYNVTIMFPLIPVDQM